MMDVLVAASPGFAAEWDAFRREWAEEADDLPLYLVLGDFARHVVDLLERNDTEALTRVFAAIELLHVNGDHYAPPPQQVSGSQPLPEGEGRRLARF